MQTTEWVYLCVWCKQGADSFAAVVAKEHDEPDIIWNMDMRQRLLDHLTSELEQYVKFRASDSMALYVHNPQAPLYYPELAGKCLLMFLYVVGQINAI